MNAIVNKNAVFAAAQLEATDGLAIVLHGMNHGTIVDTDEDKFGEVDETPLAHFVVRDDGSIQVW